MGAVNMSEPEVQSSMAKLVSTSFGIDLDTYVGALCIILGCYINPYIHSSICILYQTIQLHHSLEIL